MAKVSLGRGLGALISDKKSQQHKDNSDAVEIEIKKISANRFQPRQNFKDDSLQELAQSIKEKGILQPLLVRKSEADKYELIAGERRFRASKLIGLKKVPVVIREASDDESLEIALIENIQRDNLSPIEEAIAYQRLTKEFNLTQDQIAEKVGKKRATISNTLRLLNLSEDIQGLIQTEQISMGHARAILSLPTEKAQNDFAMKVVAEGLSVRETERLITNKLHPLPKDKKKLKTGKRDAHVADLEEKLQSYFGSHVAIQSKGKSGKIEIYFNSLDDFDRILDKIGLKN